MFNILEISIIEMISNIIASIEESCFFFPQDFLAVQQILDGRVEGERESDTRSEICAPYRCPS